MLMSRVCDPLVCKARESENCGWTVKIQDCDFEGRPCVFRNAFGTLFTVTVKLRAGAYRV